MEAPEAVDLSTDFATLVLQPTPLCNMRCSYCYLTDLSNPSRMPVEIPRMLAQEFAEGLTSGPVEVRWHAGEPLTVGARHLSLLWEPFDELRHADRMCHSLQTNGTLIDDEWCALFRRHDVKVGLSIDGPRWAGGQRRSLSGAETFDRAMRGVECLRRNRVAFNTIAVVTLAAIPTIIERIDEYFDFFRSLGTEEVGFNIEEQEGRHKVLADRDLVGRYWEAVFDAWLRCAGQPPIRDFRRVLNFARASLTGERPSPRIDLLPTVTHDGDVVVLSPELAGYRDDRYGHFIAGNLNEESLAVILRRALGLRYVQEFREGARACRSSCRYFDYCRAGTAGNRYFEHGQFVTNETTYCRHSRQVPFDVVLGL